MNAFSLPQSPRTAEALYAVGHRLFGSAHYYEALRIFRALVMATPADERAWLALGLCEERLGDTSKALALYSMGAIAVPTAGRCCLAAARLLREEEHADAADEAFDRALERAESVGDVDLANEIRTARAGS